MTKVLRCVCAIGLYHLLAESCSRLLSCQLSKPGLLFYWQQVILRCDTCYKHYSEFHLFWTITFALMYRWRSADADHGDCSTCHPPAAPKETTTTTTTDRRLYANSGWNFAPNKKPRQPTTSLRFRPERLQSRTYQQTSSGLRRQNDHKPGENKCGKKKKKKSGKVRW